MSDSVRVIPEVGDRVRLVVEGEVTQTYVAGATYGRAIELGGYEYYPDYDEAGIVSVEILPPPEPEWRPGDAVLDADGRALLRRTAGGSYPWADANGWVKDDDAARPLTLIARNGQPVAG